MLLPIFLNDMRHASPHFETGQFQWIRAPNRQNSSYWTQPQELQTVLLGMNTGQTEYVLRIEIPNTENSKAVIESETTKKEQFPTT